MHDSQKKSHVVNKKEQLKPSCKKVDVTQSLNGRNKLESNAFYNIAQLCFFLSF